MDERLLFEKYPTLYHMAEVGTWSSIREHGLLSTEALLDKLGTTPDERLQILETRRPRRRVHKGVVIRDQKPMNHNLEAVLKPANLLPTDWLRFLNRKVFFWTSPARLDKFRGAYRMQRQLIIEVPTQRIVEAHRESVRLCHINSGATRMPDHYRSFETFQTIELFQYSSKMEPAEFTVDYEVKDIAELASRVYETGLGERLVLI